MDVCVCACMDVCMHARMYRYLDMYAGTHIIYLRMYVCMPGSTFCRVCLSRARSLSRRRMPPAQALS